MPSAADDPRQTGSSIDRRRVGIAGQLSSLTQLSPFLKWSSLYYDPILVSEFFLDLEQHTLVIDLFLNGFSKLRVEEIQLLNGGFFKGDLGGNFDSRLEC